MFTLRVQYLTGRVCAAPIDEGDAKESVEWPPHPSRLFSALVSSWAEGGGEPELRGALEWLELQPPPEICFSPGSGNRMVEAYVPVNDSRERKRCPIHGHARRGASHRRRWIVQRC